MARNRQRASFTLDSDLGEIHVVVSINSGDQLVVDVTRYAGEAPDEEYLSEAIVLNLDQMPDMLGDNLP